MLRHNSTVTHLDLSWNDLGVEGGKALLEGMQANHAVIDLQLSGNRVAEDTLHAIAFILRRNRQTAPMGASTFRQERAMTAQDPASPGRASPSASVGFAPTTPGTRTNAERAATPGSPGFGSTARSVNLNIPSEAGLSPSPREGPATSTLPPATPAKVQPPVHDEETLKLLQREQNHSNAEDARFFGEVAEYIDLLQLDVARNKKYRMDAEERERVVTKGFMEREMRYAQEMRELENLLAKAKAEKDEILHDAAYVQHEIDRVRAEKSQCTDDRLKMEEVARSTADRLRADIRDALTTKADLETQIYKTKRRQQEQEEENARLRPAYEFHFVEWGWLSRNDLFHLVRRHRGYLKDWRFCSSAFLWGSFAFLCAGDGTADCRRVGPCGESFGCSFQDWLEVEEGNATTRLCLREAYRCAVLDAQALAEGCRPGLLRVLLSGIDQALKRCEELIPCFVEVEHVYSQVLALWRDVPHWDRHWSLQSLRQKVEMRYDREMGIKEKGGATGSAGDLDRRAIHPGARAERVAAELDLQLQGAELSGGA
ncbi:unnamed protein product [Effrenium voratum]|nr:unnamed protein product [Effrenium voratum]